MLEPRTLLTGSVVDLVTFADPKFSVDQYLLSGDGNVVVYSVTDQQDGTSFPEEGAWTVNLNDVVAGSFQPQKLLEGRVSLFSIAANGSRVHLSGIDPVTHVGGAFVVDTSTGNKIAAPGPLFRSETPFIQRGLPGLRLSEDGQRFFVASNSSWGFEVIQLPPNWNGTEVIEGDEVIHVVENGQQTSYILRPHLNPQRHSVIYSMPVVPDPIQQGLGVTIHFDFEEFFAGTIQLSSGILDVSDVGDRILVQAVFNGRTGFFTVVDSQFASFNEILVNGFPAHNPILSPNGQQIVYSAKDASGNNVPALQPVVGGAPKILSTPGTVAGMTLTADRLFVRHAAPDRAIVTYSVSTSDVDELGQPVRSVVSTEGRYGEFASPIATAPRSEKFSHDGRRRVAQQSRVATTADGTEFLSQGLVFNIIEDKPFKPHQSFELVVNTSDDTFDGVVDAKHTSLREALAFSDALDGVGASIKFQAPGDLDIRLAFKPTLFLGGTLIARDTVVIDGALPSGKVILRPDPANRFTFDSGLVVESSSSTILGLHFEDFWVVGLLVNGDQNIIEGNFFGELSPNNRGIEVRGSFNQLRENLIVNSGAGDGHSNVNRYGLWIRGGDDNIVTANRIGIDASGNPAPNREGGIVIEPLVGLASRNEVGGIDPADANQIAATDSYFGVVINSQGTIGGTRSPVSNSILGNSILGKNAIGLDSSLQVILRPNDPLDADSGANNRQNFPVLTNLLIEQSQTTMDGTLHSEPNRSYRIEFFENASSGRRAESFLGAQSVTTDASGNASFHTTIPKAIGVGHFVTATATVDLGTGRFGDTSVASEPFTPPDAIVVNTISDAADFNPDDGVLDVNPNVVGNQVSLRAAITFANSTPGGDTIEFNIPAAEGNVISVAATLPTVTQPLVLAGNTQPGSQRIIIDGASTSGSTSGLSFSSSSHLLNSLTIRNFAGAGIDWQSAGNKLTVDELQLLSNRGWGIQAGTGGLDLKALNLNGSRTLIRDNGSQLAGGGGIWSDGMLEAQRLLVEQNQGPGIAARGDVRLSDTQSNRNIGPGIQSLGGEIEFTTATNDDNQVIGNHGPGLLANDDPLFPEAGVIPSQGESSGHSTNITVGSSIQVRDNFGWGLLTRRGNVFVNAPPSTGSPQGGADPRLSFISNNGGSDKGIGYFLDSSGELVPISSATADRQGGIGALEVVAGRHLRVEENHGPGIAARGDVRLSDTQSNRNIGPGIQSLGGEIAFTTATNDDSQVIGNHGPGILAGVGNDFPDTLPPGNDIGFDASSTVSGRIAINSVIQVRDNHGWGILSRLHEVSVNASPAQGGLGGTDQRLSVIEHNGGADQGPGYFLFDDGTLHSTTASELNVSGGIGSRGALAGLRLRVNQNHGPGIAALGNIDLIDTQSNQNVGPGIQSLHGKIEFSHRPSDDNQVIGNQGPGLFAGGFPSLESGAPAAAANSNHSILIHGAITITDNNGWGVVTPGGNVEINTVAGSDQPASPMLSRILRNGGSKPGRLLYLDDDGDLQAANFVTRREAGGIASGGTVVARNLDVWVNATHGILAASDVTLHQAAINFNHGVGIESRGDLTMNVGEVRLNEVANFAVTGTTTLNQVTVEEFSDDDDDGATGNEENNGPHNGDGNQDGTPDSQQAHVTTFVATGGEYVTIAATPGQTLQGVHDIANPSPTDTPPDADFGVGFFEFQVNGLTAGAATSVDLFLPDGVTASAYYKFGSTPDDPLPHWYRFDFDGTTGAEIIDGGRRVRLHFVDGGRGDDDLTANGIIVDPGAPDVTPEFNPMTITLAAANANTRLRVNATTNHVELVNAATGAVLLDLTADGITQLTLNGGRADNRLTVDFRNGSPLPIDGLFFNGGRQELQDDLVLVGGSFGSVTHTFASRRNGTVTLDGATITYTGLEPITDNLVAVDRVFEFAATNDAITLADASSLVNGRLRLSSVRSSETVVFAAPTGSLTLRSGAGDDSVTVSSLDGLFVTSNAMLVIEGGDGNDSLDASQVSKSTTLRGGLGRDTLRGGANGDLLQGGANRDLLFGNRGNDTIHGDGGNDELQGDNGDDSLEGGVGDDSIQGGAGADQLLGGVGRDTIHGGADNDTLLGGDDHDMIFGGSGADILGGQAGRDLLVGDDGQDTLLGGTQNDTLYGGSDNDALLGEAGNDELVGDGGPRDTLAGGGGTDLLFGSDDEIDESFSLNLEDLLI